jgi:tetratricopeptide (TPR) repeat protein
MLPKFPPFLLVAALLAATFASARDKNDNWIQVTSPHFVVVTNANEKQGRRVADQFERMRFVFHKLFPKMKVDSSAPIIVLAIKDEKDFRALEPEAYLAKGSLKLGGLFLRTADKNYVLMRLDAEGDHPYSVVYHEYTHLLTSKSEFMPLWLNEGLAQFYQNTDIHEKDVWLGEPSSESLYVLRQGQWLPLPVLFTVDHNSPYYHEENKGSIFYAESWAVVHYLEVNDFLKKTERIGTYLTLLSQNVDPQTAATKAFGDLKALETAVASYVRQGGLSFFKMPTSTEVDDSSFKVQALTGAQSDAVRADFLAYNERTKDAQVLLDRVLHEEPNNVSAHETKGFIEFKQGHIEEAKKWYARAVELDSQSYLAHYYFAAMSMNERGDTAEQEKVEQSLRTAIKLNPDFAPSFDRLAVFLASHNKSLDEAHMMELTAVSLDPANIAYRLNVAHVLMLMNQPKNAIQVLQSAQKLASNSSDSAMVDSALMRAQEYTERPSQVADERGSTGAVSVERHDGSPQPRLVKRSEFVGKGPHRFVVGVLKGVHCENPALLLSVSASGKDLALRGDDYFKIRFSTLGFQPAGDLNPCSDLENRPAKVEYVESANPSQAAQLISVELHK